MADLLINIMEIHDYLSSYIQWNPEPVKAADLGDIIQPTHHIPISLHINYTRKTTLH